MVESVTNTSQKIVGFWTISPQEMSFYKIGGLIFKNQEFTKGKRQLGGIEVDKTR